MGIYQNELSGGAPSSQDVKKQLTVPVTVEVGRVQRSRIDTVACEESAIGMLYRCDYISV